MLSQEFTYRSLKSVIENLQHSLEELSFQKDNTHIDELYKLKLLSCLRTLDIHTDYPQINSYIESILKPEIDVKSSCHNSKFLCEADVYS